MGWVHPCVFVLVEDDSTKTWNEDNLRNLLSEDQFMEWAINRDAQNPGLFERNIYILMEEVWVPV